MNREELQRILDSHAKWIRGERADLRSADLRYANLERADLRSARTDKRYIVISCIGRRKGSTTYCFDDDQVWCGCFGGTLAEFEKKMRETHADNPQYLAEYTGAIAYIRSLQGAAAERVN